MATWNSIIRRVLVRGNFFSGDAAQLVTSYDTAHFTQSLVTRNGAEYSFNAIVDSILDAHEMLVTAIGENPQSEYRRWFQDVTASIAHAELIPQTGTVTKERYGVISDVKDASLNRYLTHQPREMIETAKKGHPRMKLELFHYFTDNVRIWHTRTNVICEIVAWDKAAERAAIIANNEAAVCPMPSALHPALEIGSLAFIQRDAFGAEAAVEAWQQFFPVINKIAGKQIASQELPVKV